MSPDDHEPDEPKCICVCGHYYEEHERWADDVVSCAIDECLGDCAEFQEAIG